MTEIPINEEIYNTVRANLLASPQLILSLEEKYMRFLQAIIADASTRIRLDFDKSLAYIPFWQNYPPSHRGRAPTKTSIPWSEVGETAIGSNIIRSLVMKKNDVTFPGLPSGADIRFATDDAFIHLDIKITGPNDKEDEVVASHNQISGDGLRWANGVMNSEVEVHGSRANMIFQPELPPFYIIEGTTLLCLTYFLKGVYEVRGLGDQPLKKLELVCVPNGLLAFDGPKYGQLKGLLIPGKDDKESTRKRTRVRMNQLSQLHSWRRVTIWQKEQPQMNIFELD